MKYYLIWWLLDAKRWAWHRNYNSFSSINDAHVAKAKEEANTFNKMYSYLIVEENTDLAKLSPPTPK